MTPIQAYSLAMHKGPSAATRKAVLTDPYLAYCYALNIDKGPRDDTRKAACGEGYYAWKYAVRVDHRLTPETEAALAGGTGQNRYELAALKRWDLEQWLDHVKEPSIAENLLNRLLRSSAEN